MEDKAIIEGARKMGIINETKVRNIKIRTEYKNLREVEKMKYEDAINKLAFDFCLAFATIERIIL